MYIHVDMYVCMYHGNVCMYEASCMYVLKMKCVHHLCPMVACVSMSCDHVLKASPTNTLFQCTMPVLMCCSLSTV